MLWTNTQILVRTRTDPRLVLHSIQKQVASVDPNQQASVWQDGLLENWIKEQGEWATGRLVSILFAAFSVVALLLAAVGLYSVISYAVAQRTNEFGIRMALGAQRRDILNMVLGSAGATVGIGVGAGLLLSLSAKPLLSHLVEGGAIDPLTIAAVTLLLLAVAALACLMPASRAASAQPMNSLRAE
jgi:putative ABC transport system permease protein